MVRQGCGRTGERLVLDRQRSVRATGDGTAVVTVAATGRSERNSQARREDTGTTEHITKLPATVSG